MNKSKKTLLIGTTGLIPPSSIGQVNLPVDSLKTISFKKEFTDIKNKDFFILGTDTTNTIFDTVNVQTAFIYSTNT